jgi:hypothetical protein
VWGCIKGREDTPIPTLTSLGETVPAELRGRKRLARHGRTLSGSLLPWLAQSATIQIAFPLDVLPYPAF